MCFGYFNGMLGLFKIGSRDHELLASGIQTALKNVVEVIFMPLGTMVFAPEDGVAQVDADLKRVR